MHSYTAVTSGMTAEVGSKISGFTQGAKTIDHIKGYHMIDCIQFYLFSAVGSGEGFHLKPKICEHFKELQKHFTVSKIYFLRSSCYVENAIFNSTFNNKAMVSTDLVRRQPYNYIYFG